MAFPFPDTTGAFVLIAQPSSDSLTDSLAKVFIVDVGLVDLCDHRYCRNFFYA